MQRVRCKSYHYSLPFWGKRHLSRPFLRRLRNHATVWTWWQLLWDNNTEQYGGLKVVVYNSSLHLDHFSKMAFGTQSSHPTPSIQSFCRRSFAFTMVGEYHPKAWNVFSTSETSALFVMLLIGGSLVTYTRKWSHEAFHSIPRVLVYWSDWDKMTKASESLKSVAMLSNTCGSLQLHCLNRKPPFSNRVCISPWNWMASCCEFAPPR